MATNSLQHLFEHGQSPWIDNITRGMLTGGELQSLIDQGIVGLTSNPTIFQKAIGAGSDYDQALQQMVAMARRSTRSTTGWCSTTSATPHAILRQVYDRTSGGDGFVSIEVRPELAHDTDKTVADGRRFFTFLNAPEYHDQGPRHRRGHPGLPHPHRRGDQRQRDAAVLDRELPGHRRGLCGGAGGPGPDRQAAPRRLLRRLVLRQPGGQRGRCAARREDQGRACQGRAVPRPARQGRDRQRQGGLRRRLPAGLLRPPLGGPRRKGRPASSAPSGPAPAPRILPTATCSTSRS